MNGTLSRLQPGMTVLFSGAPHRVVMVNDCRARIVAVDKLRKTVLLAGRLVTFSGEDRALNISPESELEILNR